MGSVHIGGAVSGTKHVPAKTSPCALKGSCIPPRLLPMLYLHLGACHSFTERSAPYRALSAPRQNLHRTAVRYKAVSVRFTQPMIAQTILSWACALHTASCLSQVAGIVTLPAAFKKLSFYETIVTGKFLLPYHLLLEVESHHW